MQCLQPVDPDEQRENILMKCEHQFEQATKRFTLEIQRRTVHLLKHVNYAFYRLPFPFAVYLKHFHSFSSYPKLWVQFFFSLFVYSFIIFVLDENGSRSDPVNHKTNISSIFFPYFSFFFLSIVSLLQWFGYFLLFFCARLYVWRTLTERNEEYSTNNLP